MGKLYRPFSFHTYRNYFKQRMKRKLIALSHRVFRQTIERLLAFLTKTTRLIMTKEEWQIVFSANIRIFYKNMIKKDFFMQSTNLLASVKPIRSFVKNI